jgi:putative membrane protein
MRYVIGILKFALFVLVLTFAIKNTETVTVRYFLGWEWQSPLIFVLLITFCAGIALGLAAGLGQMFKQRREIAALNRKLRDVAPRETGVAEAAAKAK